MREIKFRGLRLDRSEFVYGDLIHGVGSKNGRIYILPHKINLAYVKDCHPLDGVEVISATIGQFTGLYDKTNWDNATESDRKYAYYLAKKNGTTPESEWKGKEIYEGDIIALDDISCPITWDDGSFQMITNYNQGKSIAVQERVKAFKIIGKIHDNPELLNQQP